MARRQDYNSLNETIADFDANSVEFIPTEEAMDIASLRGSDLQSMMSYMGQDGQNFAKMIRLRPDLFNLTQPFAFSRFVDSAHRDV